MSVYEANLPNESTMPNENKLQTTCHAKLSPKQELRAKQINILEVNEQWTCTGIDKDSITQGKVTEADLQCV